MSDSQKILTEAIFPVELKRRWKAIRGAMKGEGIVFLVMQNDNEWLGEYMRFRQFLCIRQRSIH